uniref:C3H1-type domain-containing protein n=1 Tax=Ananas comosus var. bracteatus TaxID=296719 RepID=A0A6V7PHK4_ANACO|nr:unnamed protein product [Ananas comosus var. bracteatus]
MATMAMVNPSERSGLNPRRSLVLLRLSPSPHKSPNLGTIKVCFYWKAGRCTRHPCPFLHGVPQHPNVGSMRKHSVGPDHWCLLSRRATRVRAVSGETLVQALNPLPPPEKSLHDEVPRCGRGSFCFYSEGSLR